MWKCFLFLLAVPLLAANSSDALITFSDGTTASGRLTVMGSRPLTINLQKDKRSRDRKIELSDIVLLTQKLEKASMERPWMFKESGKTDKVYFEGEYGIRIENVLAVKFVETGKFGDFYGFETFTLVPLSTAAIKKELLSEAEVRWIDGYNSTVFKKISPLLDAREREWLRKETLPIG